MGNANVGILIGAKNEASAIIKQVSKDLSGINGAAQVATGGLAGIAGAFGVGAVLGAVQQVGQAITDMAAKAAQVELLSTSFDNLASSAGQSSQSMLSALREASNGMISDADLMLSANKAMMLGVADTADEMATLLQVAQARGAAMGLTATQAFNDIVTGLGRESALILDNLGITVDLDRTMREYAKTLGVTASALDATQRKQALLNEVMRQSQGMKAPTPTGAGAAMAQAQAAQENASAAMGRFFASGVRDYNQGIVDLINQLSGEWNSLDVAIRETSDLLADVKLPDSTVTQLQRYVEVAQQARQAQKANIEGAGLWVRMLDDMAARAMTGTLNAGDATKIEQVSRALERAREAAAAQAEAQARATAEAQRAVPYYQQVVQRTEEMAAAAFRAQPEIQNIATKLGIIGTIALQTAVDLDTFNSAVNRIGGGFAAADKVQAIRDSAISAANANAQRAVDAGVDPEVVAKQLGEITDRIWNMAGPTDQTTESMFLFGQEVNSVDDSLESSTAQMEEANRAATRLASGGIKSASAAYDDLKSKVASVIADSMDLGVTWEGMDSTQGGDSINENAKRLAAIANEGLQGQPWLDEFIAEVPGVYADLMLKQAAGVDVKTAAQQIMAEFQQGLRPELLDRDMIKQRVKDMIIGQENAAKLATEIAQELATEMNIPFQQALSAASSALGVAPTGAAGESATGGTVDMTGSGNAAGTTFAAGFAANADGTILIAGIVAKMETQLPRIYSAGAIHGTQWGAGFMSTVETSIGVPLVNLLTVLITPGVLAAIKANESQTTPP